MYLFIIQMTLGDWWLLPAVELLNIWQDNQITAPFDTVLLIEQTTMYITPLVYDDHVTCQAQKNASKNVIKIKKTGLWSTDLTRYNW